VKEKTIQDFFELMIPMNFLKAVHSWLPFRRIDRGRAKGDNGRRNAQVLQCTFFYTVLTRLPGP